MRLAQGVLGVAVIFGYLLVEGRGMVFSRTDNRPRPGYQSGRPRGGGFFFWGTGYRGGK